VRLSGYGPERAGQKGQVKCSLWLACGRNVRPAGLLLNISPGEQRVRCVYQLYPASLAFLGEADAVVHVYQTVAIEQSWIRRQGDFASVGVGSLLCCAAIDKSKAASG
jgi:hypothetical protein